ncbi:hypothetical protein HPB47_022464 [Ixodes persulcatus]|uniref:Uncharacterized protein n=1 Tax=Ixodes persulcatus TaxID=34615 RepID=A0AC60Q9M7_IXOPE|nr:hypothetical protein HPB47_022464 [Ixodes persulcatus]
MRVRPADSGHHTMPLLVLGEFKVNVRGGHNQWLIEHMRSQYGLTLCTDTNKATSHNGTTIGLILSRLVHSIQTAAYVAYFTLHRSLMCMIYSPQD